ncbi:ArsR family transcriptional regulator [Natronococcus sp. A-GB7]|uniref:helix-turn-helix transcriptional regulator n=1 Tax=Natronococcus sp. A-GB7 TaxID=3037649 RepID=UPI00241BFD14|nr:ArsR family transcriptional regulator [Natronococcus sp. A-GB7]MDG5821553.1 ArsR family transcriptional regulator [Natronococcus sp. A-GB7]
MKSTSSDLCNTLRKRSELLQALASTPRTKSELSQKLPISRSTVSRGLKVYEEHDCVEQDKEKYRITTTGLLALTAYNRYIESISSVIVSSGELNSLPEKASVDISFVRNAQRYPADPSVPGMAFEASNEIIRSSDHFLGLAPVALPSYPRSLYEILQEQDLQAEIVIEKYILKRLQESCSDVMQRLEQMESVSFWLATQPLPYSIWIAKSAEQNHAGLTIHANGGVQAVLINNDPKAVNWALNQYQEFRDEAAPLD